jgi:hypothetical protein
MQLDAGIVLDAAVSAAQKYAALMVDDDPDDGKHVVPGELRRFCARLRLLNGVPFSYLVPDAELLPIESIRFFYVDRAWTDALVQGVLSVGTITTADRAQLEAVYPYVRNEVDGHAWSPAGPTCTSARTQRTSSPTTRSPPPPSPIRIG